jgi:iron complex outermembrane recepter protein
MFRKVLIVLLAVGLCIAGYAEEIIEKEEVVITAEKRNTNLSKTGRGVTVITSKEIEEKGATTVAEAMETLPGVIVSDITGNGKSAVIDIRGQGESAATNIAVYVDGVKQNAMDMSGSDFLTIDIAEVERIEVVKGANSVLYGDRAIGGAIHIITKKIKGKSMFYGNGKVVVEEDGSNKESIKLNFNSKKIKSYIFAGNNRKEGYRDNSELHAYDLSYYIEGDITQKNKISLKLLYHKDDYGLPGSLTAKEMEADRKQTKKPEDYGKSEMKGGTLTHKYTDENLEIKTNFAYINREKESKMFGKIYDLDGRKYIASSDVIYSLGKNKIIAGSEILHEDNKSKSDKILKKSIEIYASDFYKIYEELELNAGVRSNITKLEIGDRKDKTFNKTVFEAGANYSYSKSGILYTRAGMGYRIPSTDEYYEAANPSYGIAEYFNDNLKPQESVEYELGIKDYFEYIGKLESSIYYSESKDEIYYDNEIGHNNNIAGKSVRKGFEIKREHSIWNIKTYQTCSYIETEVKKTGKEIPWVPNLKAGAGFKWDITEKVILNTDCIYTGKRYALSDAANKGGKVSSQTVFNSELKYSLKNIVLFTGVKNLFNKKYSDYIINYTGTSPKYYPSAERIIYIGTSFSF